MLDISHASRIPVISSGKRFPYYFLTTFHVSLKYLNPNHIVIPMKSYSKEMIRKRLRYLTSIIE